jgi:hypothetical protein
MRMILLIRDQHAAAKAARVLRKGGMTVDIAMTTSIASAMMGASPYDIVVFEHGLAPKAASPEPHGIGRTPTLVEVAAVEVADPDVFASNLRAFAQRQ